MTVPDESTSGILGYWCSSKGIEYWTLCALIEAGSKELAETLITNKKHWPDAGKWRFCKEQADGWEPKQHKEQMARIGSRHESRCIGHPDGK